MISKSNNKILSISGSYWTGSSAVIDLLKEHNDCFIVPEEFAVFSYGQFFKEVYDPISKGNVLDDKQFLNLIRIIKFNESEPKYLYSLARYLCRLMGIVPLEIFHKRMGMSKMLGKKYHDCCIDLYEYLEVSANDISSLDISTINKLIRRILIEAANHIGKENVIKSFDKDWIIFDQLVAPPYGKYAIPAIPDLHLIHVNRDWRDQYVDIRNRLGPMIKIHAHLSLKPYGEKLEMQKLEPLDFFVELVKLTNSVKKEYLDHKEDNILWLEFENIVFNTESTAQEIFNFLEISPNNWERNTIFLPNISKKNIGQWKTCPWQDEIKYIEEKLNQDV